MVLDDVAVGANIDGRYRGLDRGHAGHQKEKAIRRNLLGELQQIDAACARHADVADHNVVDLGFQFAARGLDRIRHLNAMAFLAEGNLKKLADRLLVIDKENQCHDNSLSPTWS